MSFGTLSEGDLTVHSGHEITVGVGGQEPPALWRGVAFTEQRSDAGHQDRGDHDLRCERQPETPVRRRADKPPRRTANDTDEDRHEATDGLHAGNDDARDQADNDSGSESGQDAVYFHAVIEPLGDALAALPRQSHDA